jgi:hypothetical protein
MFLKKLSKFDLVYEQEIIAPKVYSIIAVVAETLYITTSYGVQVFCVLVPAFVLSCELVVAESVMD